MLGDVVLLPTPFYLGDIGGLGITVTHYGFLRFLLPEFALYYYSLNASAPLVSLGYLQMQGGSYYT